MLNINAPATIVIGSTAETRFLFAMSFSLL